MWQIGCGKDDLWVKWVHAIYIRDTDWWSYHAPVRASWVIKYLSKVKDELQQISMRNWSADNHYSIKNSMSSFKGTCLRWIGLKDFGIGFHYLNRFIAWLDIRSRLRTKDKLFQYNIISTDNLCCLCGNSPETHTHLFFECVFNKVLMSNMLHWIGVQYRSKSLQQWLNWVRRSYHGTKIRKQIVYIVIVIVVLPSLKGEKRSSLEP